MFQNTYFMKEKESKLDDLLY